MAGARPPSALPDPELAAPAWPSGAEDEGARRERAQSLNTEGFRAYKRRDYEAARRLYAEATVADPDYGLAWYNLACMEAMRGEGGGALRALTRYRALVPTEDLLQKLDTDDDFEPLRADETFRRGVAALMGVAPTPAPPKAAQADDDEDDDELVSAGGGASDPRTLGEAALRRGAYDEAQPLLREAALGAPRDASLWFALARSEGGRGNVAGALFALKKYRGLKPQEDLIYKVGEDDAFGPVWRDARFQRELGALAAP